jgi:hypothetical protein
MHGWFPCKYCIKGFSLFGWPPNHVSPNAKVTVVCPGCGISLSLYAWEIDVIGAGLPADPVAQSFAVGPVEAMPKGYVRDLNLRFEVFRRQNLEKYGLL